MEIVKLRNNMCVEIGRGITLAVAECSFTVDDNPTTFFHLFEGMKKVK
jgi:hypothetical protein